MPEPRITKMLPAEVEFLVKKHFQLDGEALALPGEVDQNFKFTTVDGVKYTTKINPSNLEPMAIEFQVELLRHLVRKQFSLDIPVVIETIDGRAVVPLSSGQSLRMYHWVEGKVLAEVNPISAALLESWGATAGQLAAALGDFDHPFAHRFYKWNPSETLYSKKFLSYLEPNFQEVANYFFDLFETKAQPYLPSLRASVNYNDAHQHNLLIKGGPVAETITGIIDFGDAIYSQTINELAIACAYAMMNYPDPLAAAVMVVKGFHDAFPLQEEELEVLFPLITARLVISVSNAAYNKSIDPQNEYLTISEKPAWALLFKLRELSPQLAHLTFRTACGFSTFPNGTNYVQWMASANKHEIIRRNNRQLKDLDLSVGSLSVGLAKNYEDIESFQNLINGMVGDYDHAVGIGGYGEVRSFYSTDAYQVVGNDGAKWRTVHLGVDLWDRAGTPVFAPLDGKVVAVKNNEGDRDYGPTIILKHWMNDDDFFYTLYGHLSLLSLELVSIGQHISAGDKIATVGDSTENGNWPPHLHFQILLDLLDYKDDFPGVAFPSEKGVWMGICPDPNVFFNHEKPSLEAYDEQKIIGLRKLHLGRNLSISYQVPLHIVRGNMQYLYDANGQRYLDTVNNVAHVGHEHPEVVAAAQRQMAMLNTNTRYLHENIVRYASDLLDTFPPELSVVYFVNSGSEANELAMRLIKHFTQADDMMAIEIGYHGNTQHCVNVSSYKFDARGGKGAPPATHVVPIPDVYRGDYGEIDPTSYFSDFVDQKIQALAEMKRPLAGFIGETIMSCGGQIELPDHYLARVYDKVRAAGGLCIADEVQVGFGRVGQEYWGFQLHGVIPDVVTLGKPIGNGHPLGAVVTTKAVAEAFDNGMEYFNTFGGNPVSSAIGHEVLKIIRREELQRNALETGDYLKRILSDLQKRFPIIGNVRGRGLFLGVELVRNFTSLEPADREAEYLINRMRSRGILMSTDGPWHNVLKIKPPLCFSKKDADFLCNNLEVVLQEDMMQPK